MKMVNYTYDAQYCGNLLIVGRAGCGEETSHK